MNTRLTCPKCNCPLTPPSGATASIACPRCNTWVDIDPACFGSCLSCHKMHQEEVSVCVEVTSEKSGSGVVKNK